MATDEPAMNPACNKWFAFRALAVFVTAAVSCAQPFTETVGQAPASCRSLLVSGVSKGAGVECMGVYRWDTHSYQGRRVFKKFPTHSSTAAWYLFFGGDDDGDKAWYIGRVVGGKKYRMEITVETHKPDFVKDQMLGEWDVDWYEIDYKMADKMPGEEPVGEVDQTFDVKVKCVCSTVAVQGVRKGATGHNCMGAYTYQPQLGESASGGRRMYRKLGDNSLAKANGHAPPLQLLYHADSKEWGIGRPPFHMIMSIRSDAEAPEAIMDAGAGDFKMTKADKSTWVVDVNGTMQHHWGITVSCACPAVRLSASLGALGRMSRPGEAAFGVFIYTGQLFDGYRVYEMPYRGDVFPSIKASVLFLYYMHGQRQWVVGPVVGSSRLRFAFVPSTAELPELIGQVTTDDTGGAKWRLASWSDSARYGLTEDSVDEVDVQLNCEWHPVMPPSPAPLLSVSQALAKQTMREQQQDVKKLERRVQALTLWVFAAILLFVLTWRRFARSGSANERSYAQVASPQTLPDMETDEAEAFLEQSSSTTTRKSPQLRKRSLRSLELGSSFGDRIEEEE